MKKILLITALFLSGSFCLVTQGKSWIGMSEEERDAERKRERHANDKWDCLFPYCLKKSKDFEFTEHDDELARKIDEHACKSACEIAKWIYLKRSPTLDDQLDAEYNAANIFDCLERLQKFYHHDLDPKDLKELVPTDHSYELIKEVQKKIKNGDISLEKRSSNLELMTAIEIAACGDCGITYRDRRKYKQCDMIETIIGSYKHDFLGLANAPYKSEGESESESESESEEG